MIYREQVWIKDKTAIIEIIPADGYELPPTFKKYRLRLSAKVYTSSGMMSSARDMVLQAETLPEAIAEAKLKYDAAQASLTEELTQEVVKSLGKEIAAK